MLEVIYRIYQVADEKTAEENKIKDTEYGLYSSVSRAKNTEVVMDCMICESREHFKDIIRSQYGDKITFRYSSKLKPGDFYCIIIGEHCYNSEKYFNKVTFKCDCCGATIETYYGKPICFSDYEVKGELYNIDEYLKKRFCSNKCKEIYLETEMKRIKPNDDSSFFVNKDMFTQDVSGYIYIITKKSTGEFYVGQTVYAPVFRWGQHLKTERFPISKITDYKFEVIEIVPKGENILEREKYWIQKKYKENPEKSLNISCTAEINPYQTTFDELNNNDKENCKNV